MPSGGKLNVSLFVTTSMTWHAKDELRFHVMVQVQMQIRTA
jgi:hypothetical protein